MSYIQNTWVAYAFDRELGVERVTAGLSRVEAHYGPLYGEPLVAHARVDGAVGMALWHPADDRLRWPLWTERDRPGGGIHQRNHRVGARGRRRRCSRRGGRGRRGPGVRSRPPGAARTRRS